MMMYALVAAGGALGSVARVWLAGTVGRLAGLGFPWGTILINVLGSFLIGLIAAWTAGRGHAETQRAFLMAGLCGGFTTFSAFSLQTVELIQDGRAASAAGNVALSLVACFAAAALGLAAGR